MDDVYHNTCILFKRRDLTKFGQLRKGFIGLRPFGRVVRLLFTLTIRVQKMEN